MQTVTKAVILLIVSGISFVLLFTFIIVWVVMVQPVTYKDNDSDTTDWDYDWPDSKFQIFYTEEDGLVISIQDDIKKTVFKGWVIMSRGKEAGLRIKNCAKLIARWDEDDKDEEKVEDKGGMEDPIEVKELTCIELEGQAKYVVEPLSYTDTDIECQSHSWTANDCRQDSFSVCFNMSTAHWYGMTNVYKQLYPLETWKRKAEPYVTNNALTGMYGAVQERYWVSSDGVAIYVDWDVPLWVSINETQDNSLCLMSQYKDSPYQNINRTPLFMNYTICAGLDIRDVHQFMVKKYIGKPIDIPNEMLFRYPIWSVWTQNSSVLNESSVLQYAYDITHHNFSHAVLEIPHQWESDYGTFDFDYNQFPDPKAMIDELNDLGFRINLLVHPFIDAKLNFSMSDTEEFELVKDPGEVLPALTSWQNSLATILDFTNNKTIQWYHKRLKDLMNSYGVNSFLFDVGQSNWLPAAYQFSHPACNPSQYSTAYAKMAFESDPEASSSSVHVGAATQNLPVFVRMEEKSSTWGFDNGLKSIIPNILTYSLIGYPYILPGAIGGSDFDGDTNDKELYIRWMQVNTFLPGFHISNPPWQFDSEVLEITHSMLSLRNQYMEIMLDLAKECVYTGAPIIRPLWWLDSYDEVALVIDSEFLVGDNILVAPVLEPGARSRDIYLPMGSWTDELTGERLKGGQWYHNYHAQLHQLPYFTRSANSLSY